MTVLMNLIRIVLASLWTAVLGLPLLAVIYVRYAYGLLRRAFGAPDKLDRMIEGNAYVAGWVAQRLWTGVLLALAGIRLRVKELKPIDWTRTHVLCANHASIFDILALLRVVPPPFRFVAKRELLTWPIIGWALYPAGQIVVDRANRSKAIKAIAQAALRKIRGQIVFFVEGTRSRTGELLPFKKGAFYFAVEHRLPILPTAICGSHSALARVPWWRMQPGRTIEVRFAEPIEVENASEESIPKLMGQTRSAIAAELAASGL